MPILLRVAVQRRLHDAELEKLWYVQGECGGEGRSQEEGRLLPPLLLQTECSEPLRADGHHQVDGEVDGDVVQLEAEHVDPRKGRAVVKSHREKLMHLKRFWAHNICRQYFSPSVVSTFLIRVSPMMQAVSLEVSATSSTLRTGLRRRRLVGPSRTLNARTLSTSPRAPTQGLATDSKKLEVSIVTVWSSERVRRFEARVVWHFGSGCQMRTSKRNRFARAAIGETFLDCACNTYGQRERLKLGVRLRC